METPRIIINALEALIEGLAVSETPSDAAERAAALIGQSYVLIPRGDLPKISYGPLGDGGNPQLLHITAGASKGDTKVMRELAYEYLVMADFLDGKKQSEEAQKLKKEQWDAYSILYPYQNMHEFEFFDYTVHTQPNIQRAIDTIVDLKRQLDKK